MSIIRVLVTGACGKMGREVIKAVTVAEGMEITAAVGHTTGIGADAGTCAGIKALGVPVMDNLAAAIDRGVDVIVEFTRPDMVMDNLRVAVPRGIAAIVGSTGLTADNLDELRMMSVQSGSPVFIAPNFAIGAVLMMEFARQAAQYFSDSEVIEFHSQTKRDAPSGTALRTAELISAASHQPINSTVEQQMRSRGQSIGSTHVHAKRLPGMVARQEVVFGAFGQTLTIRHDSISHASFMPGVLLAIRSIQGLDGVVVGLDAII